MPENTSNFSDKEKEKLIKAEILRLRKIFKHLGTDGLSAIKSLIDEAAFMSITLMDLRKTINREGTVSFYQNGANQWGTKKSPEIEIYNTMIKNHMTLMKQIQDLLPKTLDNDDGFDSFIGNRDE